MTQDNIQQTDTPQENANEQYTSLEEAVFGNEGSVDNIASAFTTGNEGNTEQAPQVGQPQVSENGNNDALVNEAIDNNTLLDNTSDNDKKRYQYWQSQADKYKNELEAVKQQAAQQPVQAPPVQENVNQAQAVEEFPPPPERPKRPRSFSREEAYTDSSSESARYLDAKEDWDEQMVEYNTLRSQYQDAILKERFDNMENQRIAEAKRQQAEQAAKAQQAEITNYVTGHHGMTAEQANDFITKMSDPSSISIDNLVQLYRMQNGNAAPQTQNAPAQPSQTFTQTKNAQQVPSPMGVMPSGNENIDGKTFEDKIMDTMIGNFNSKNPWK